MKLHQQTPGCADIDVTLSGEGNPDFRLLLPEHIYANGYDGPRHLHTIPGAWEHQFGLLGGRYTVPHAFEIAVLLIPNRDEVRVSLTIVNIADHPVEDVFVEVCAGVNHLPGNPGWSNRGFIGECAPDRVEQGRVWFDEITPNRLVALTSAGAWIPIHPNPKSPHTANSLGFVPSDEVNARAVALESPEEPDRIFFQSWDNFGRWVTPAPENACIHLRPYIANRLDTGESATTHGLVGVFTGDRGSLAYHLLAALS